MIRPTSPTTWIEIAVHRELKALKQFPGKSPNHLQKEEEEENQRKPKMNRNTTTKLKALKQFPGKSPNLIDLVPSPQPYLQSV